MKKKLNFIISLVVLVSLIILDFLLIKSNLLKIILLVALNLGELIFIVTPYIFKGKIKTIINIFLTVLLLVVNTIGSVAVKKVIDSFNDLDDNNKTHETTHDYILFAHEDSQIKTVEDIKGLTIGVYDNQAIVDVFSSLVDENTVDMILYQNVEQLLDDINKGYLQAIFVSASVYGLMFEEYRDDVSLKEITRKTIKESDEVSLKKVDLNNDIFNIYLMGSDNRDNLQFNNTDVNIIITVDTVNKKLLLTGIPRDCFVELAIGEENHDKLTHSSYYGTNCTIRTVENLLDIDINYYFRVTFDTVTLLVDALGGLDVQVDQDFTTDSHYVFKKGIMHMNGQEALSFARERHAFSDGVNTRIRHQQELFKALLNTCMSSRTILNHYSELLDVIADTFTTNMPSEDISELVKNQLLFLKNFKIEQQFLSGFSAFSTECYSYPNQNLWVMEINPESLAAAKQKIKDFSKR